MCSSIMGLTTIIEERVLKQRFINCHKTQLTDQTCLERKMLMHKTSPLLSSCWCHGYTLTRVTWIIIYRIFVNNFQRRRRRSDPVLWQNIPIPTENSETKRQHINAIKNFDYTTSTKFKSSNYLDTTFEFEYHLSVLIVYREKGRDLTQSYDKSPYTNRNVKRAMWQHKQRHKKFD